MSVTAKNPLANFRSDVTATVPLCPIMPTPIMVTKTAAKGFHDINSVNQNPNLNAKLTKNRNEGGRAEVGDTVESSWNCEG